MISALYMISVTGYSQFVVSAPALEAEAMKNTGILGKQSGLLAGMKASMAMIEAAEKNIEEIKKDVKWIEKLKSVQEFIKLLETTAQ